MRAPLAAVAGRGLSSAGGGPLNPRAAIAIAAVLAVLAGLYLWLPTGPGAKPELEAEPTSARSRTRPGTPVTPPPPLPDPPPGTTTEALQTLAEHAQRTLIACPVPPWLDEVGVLRPAWVEGDTLYELVATAPSQRLLYASPRLELSYTLDEVEAAASDPELREAILAEAAAANPKAQPRELLGALRWEAAEPGEPARCTVHDANALVTLTVYVEDAAGELVPAFVKVGERGVRAEGGIAQVEAVAGVPVRISAHGEAGRAAMRAVPGEGTEVVLTLGDIELPEPPPMDLDAALTQAGAQLEAEGKAALHAYRDHLRSPGPADPLLEAVHGLGDPVAAAEKKSSLADETERRPTVKKLP